MEDILASIRRLISEDQELDSKDTPEALSKNQTELGSNEKKDDNILELTTEVDESGNIIDNMNHDKIDESYEKLEGSPIDKLIGDPAISEAVDTLNALNEKVSKSELEPDKLEFDIKNRTLEDHVLEMLRPMLKDWLDSNLPPLVERLVQREIDRMVNLSKLP